jgi:ADP-heptose:LPS heptosyltransferase
MAARLVVATDAGLAHLAVLCGTPLLLVGADGGKVAPGPARNAQGKVEHEEYWHVRLDEYYHQANHTNAPLHFMSDGWGDPSAVVAHAEGILQ